jgi:hypothetical protein
VCVCVCGCVCVPAYVLYTSQCHVRGERAEDPKLPRRSPNAGVCVCVVVGGYVCSAGAKE